MTMDLVELALEEDEAHRAALGSCFHPVAGAPEWLGDPLTRLLSSRPVRSGGPPMLVFETPDGKRSAVLVAFEHQKVVWYRAWVSDDAAPSMNVQLVRAIAIVDSLERATIQDDYWSACPACGNDEGHRPRCVWVELRSILLQMEAG